MLCTLFLRVCAALRRSEGQGLVEYAILTAIIAAGAILLLGFIGSFEERRLGALNEALQAIP